MFYEAFVNKQQTAPQRLSAAEVERLLIQLKTDWKSIDGKSLQSEFTFPNFGEAMLFVNEVAALAEEYNHHPNIFVRFTKVTIELSTHEVEGLTEKDFSLARNIEICC